MSVTGIPSLLDVTVLGIDFHYFCFYLVSENLHRHSLPLNVYDEVGDPELIKLYGITVSIFLMTEAGLWIGFKFKQYRVLSCIFIWPIQFKRAHRHTAVIKKPQSDVF